MADRVAKSLMKDNRVALTLDSLMLAMQEEFHRIRNIPVVVWMLLAELTLVDAYTLRHSCIRAGHRCWAFFNWRVLEPAQALPWTLCRGDIAENLRHLKSGDRPTENISAKIWDMLHTGVALNVLVRLVQCLGDSPWLGRAEPPGKCTF